MIVRVWTDVGAKKPVALLAKVVERDGVIYTIRYLTEGKDKVWRYEDDTYEIDDDSIAEHLGTDQETDLGFVECEYGFIRESDSDYEPSDEEDETESDDDDDEEDDEEDCEEDEEEFGEEESEEEENVEE
jgi:hypothetical protein